MRALCLALSLSLLPGSILATDGVIELSHAKALAGDPFLVPPDAPGYPIEIRDQGSYRLTSDLSVPANVTGIVLMADVVNLDLNGFTIRGSEFCSPGQCQPASSSYGIVHDPGGGGFFVTVRNGVVSGFGASCIRLRDGGRVENVRVFACGEHGIHLRAVSFPSFPGTAFENYVTNTGNSSLVFEGGGLFRDNVLLNAGLYFASPTIVGGSATGGNLCDDGRCSRRGKRRFYLTPAEVAADQTLTACETGFHMAARNELANPELEYDARRGFTTQDAGSGPPVGESSATGWARSGGDAHTDNAVLFGWANCAAWTSGSSTDRGTLVGLVTNFDVAAPNLAGYAVSQPWVAYGPFACDSKQRVWCIED